ncbi:MAG: transposase, partial [Albidovulum sp.]|nr:transposase [Albidovulum sp.]
LAIDEAGFPMRAEVLPGKVSEPSTLSGAVGRLAKSSSGDAKLTVVMDAGIASNENLEWLRSKGCHWISVDCGSMPPAPEGPPDAKAETAAGHGAKAWLLEKEGGEPEHALEVVSRDEKRWLIEEYFKALKVGTRIKDRRLNLADDLRKCLAFDAITACGVMSIKRLARSAPDAPARAVVHEDEVRVLAVHMSKPGHRGKRGPPGFSGFPEPGGPLPASPRGFGSGRRESFFSSLISSPSSRILSRNSAIRSSLSASCLASSELLLFSRAKASSKEEGGSVGGRESPNAVMGASPACYCSFSRLASSCRNRYRAARPKKARDWDNREMPGTCPYNTAFCKSANMGEGTGRAIRSSAT